MKWFICFGLFIAASMLLADDLVWEWQNPKPQGNTLYDVAVLDENTMIAVGEHGTIVRTEDGGETWDVQHHIGSTAERDARLNAVHFVNLKTGWIASNTGMLKTTDGGDTWSVQDASSFSTCHFACADTGWACTGGMIKKTTDGGQTWHATIIDTNEVRGLSFQDIYFINSSLGWVIGRMNFAGELIYRTIDGGISWKCMSGYADYPISILSSIYFLDSGWGWAASNYDGKVIHSKTNGATWKLQDTGINKDIYSIQFINKTTGYAVCEGGIIITTHDSGETWRTIESPVNQSLRSIRFYNDTVAWAVGINGAMIKTTDGGQTWQNMQEVSITTSLNDIFFIDENVGWAVGKGGSIYKTVNGGEEWNIKRNDGDEEFHSVQFIDKIGVCVGALNELNFSDGGIVLMSIDSGETWEDISPDSIEALRSVFMISDSKFYTAGYYGAIYKVINYGKEYYKQYSDAKNRIDDIFFINDLLGWHVGSGIYCTSNGGLDWVHQGEDKGGLSIMFLNSDFGWIAGGYSILFSNDGGDNWEIQEYENITDEYFHSIFFVDSLNGWLLGKNIYKTDNAGANWALTDYPQKYDMYSVSGYFKSMSFLDENNGWFCGAGNEIIKVSSSATGVEIDNNIQSMPKTLQLFQNYPNPFNPSTTIQYYLSKDAHVILSIYNAKGQLVEKLIDRYQVQGKYYIAWNADGMPSGVYFYRLNTDNYSKTKKLLLLR